MILKRILRALWVVIAILLFVLTVYGLFPLVYPFLLAWLIAYAMNPLVLFLHRVSKLPHWLAVTLSLFVYVAVFLLILSAAITRFVKELIGLTETFDIHIEHFKNLFVSWTKSDFIQNIIVAMDQFIRENPGYQQTINDNIDKTTQNVSNAVTGLVSHLFNGMLSFLTALPNMGAVLMVIVLSAFFISKNWDNHRLTFSRYIPATLRKTVIDIWQDLRRALFGFLWAQFVIVSIIAMIVIIGLIILHVDSAFTIGLMIGIIDLLPYIGVGIVMIPWVIYAFMSDQITLGLGLSILYIVILIARQIVEPKVLASSVGLDPLATLIATFVGLKLFGVPGLLIGSVSLVVLDAFNRAHVLRDLRNYILVGRIR